jgi:hypothetical protein
LFYYNIYVLIIAESAEMSIGDCTEKEEPLPAAQGSSHVHRIASHLYRLPPESVTPDYCTV